MNRRNFTAVATGAAAIPTARPVEASVKDTPSTDASPAPWTCVCCGDAVLNSQEILLSDEDVANLERATLDDRFGQLKSESRTHGLAITHFETDRHVTILASYRGKHYCQRFELFNEHNPLWKPLWEAADIVTRAVIAAQTQCKAHVIECLLRKFVP